MVLEELETFLEEQWSFILIIVIIFITLLTLFSILGVNFNPSTNKIIQKEVVVEGLDSNLSVDFCKKYSAGSTEELEKKCNRLTPANCNTTDCCVMLNGSKCVAGNAKGPTFLSKDKKDIDVLYYTYKDKCFGKGCPMNK